MPSQAAPQDWTASGWLVGSPDAPGLEVQIVPWPKSVRAFNSDERRVCDSHPYVSAMAALSLGQMKVRSAEPVLRNYYAPDIHYTESLPRPSVMGFACRLALEAITEQPLPPLVVDPFVVSETDWFLEPLGASTDP